MKLFIRTQIIALSGLSNCLRFPTVKVTLYLYSLYFLLFFLWICLNSEITRYVIILITRIKKNKDSQHTPLEIAGKFFQYSTFVVNTKNKQYSFFLRLILKYCHILSEGSGVQPCVFKKVLLWVHLILRLRSFQMASCKNFPFFFSFPKKIKIPTAISQHSKWSLAPA